VSDRRSLRFTRSAEKELRRLDPPIRSRVLSALDRLAADDRSLFSIWFWVILGLSYPNL